MVDIHVPTLGTANIRQEGTRVQVLLNGKLVIDLPWDAAEALAKAIHVQAKRAEEWAKAQQIADDQSVLMRAGFPVGLSDHPAIVAEARKEAAWNSDLRRYMPSSIRSGEVFGTPTISQQSQPKRGTK